MPPESPASNTAGPAPGATLARPAATAPTPAPMATTSPAPTPATPALAGPATPAPALTRGQSTVQLLRQRLQDGTWSVGTKLPGEHDLAAELGVGRNTLREALRSLVGAGLLRARRGDGTYVIATDELEVALSRRVTLEERLHAFEVRSALEVEAARLAATRATAEELEHLTALTEERRTASHGASEVAFLRLDLAWHDAVARAAHNPILLEIYLGLDRVNTYFSHNPEAEARMAALAAGIDDGNGAEVRRRLPRLDLTHDHLLAALLARDPIAAAEAASRIFAASEQLHALPGDPA